MQYCGIAVLCMIGEIIDPYYQNGIGRVGETELPLNRRDIAVFFDEVPAHGVARVIGSVTLDAGQAA
jgi:hypothetical protein